MKARVLAWALACAAFAALPAQAQPASEADALHVLNRLGYGPAPGDLARVRQVGIDRYIDEQLHPERLPLPADLAQRLADGHDHKRTSWHVYLCAAKHGTSCRHV